MKPCKKCGCADRYPSGGCRPCTVAANTRRAIENPERVKIVRDKWRELNKSKIYAQNRAWIERSWHIPRAPRPRTDSNTRGPWSTRGVNLPCAKCGSFDRTSRGYCKPCTHKSKKQYLTDNAERMRLNRVRYLSENADKVRMMRQNRRARLSNAGVLSPNICAELFILQCGRCACCGLTLNVEYDLDHVMPLALGGLNVDENMQLLTSKCNGRKLVKHPDDYARAQGFSYWPRRDWAAVTRK